MWTFTSATLSEVQGLRFSVALNTQPATFADVLQGWISDPEFRLQFGGALAKAPFDAFRWETPAITNATLSRPFEFVLLDSPELVCVPDPRAFAEHFQQSPDARVVAFSNLGRNAILIVPCPRAESSAYGHLAAFVREAPLEQRQAFWQSVGEALTRRVGLRPVWLSTAGAVVAWLHVRLDDHPKYYRFASYRRTP